MPAVSSAYVQQQYKQDVALAWPAHQKPVMPAQEARLALPGATMYRY